MSRKAVSGMMLSLLSIGMLTLAFNVQPVESDWIWTETIYIRADGSVEPETAPVSTVDNVTYTLTDNIVVDIYEDLTAIVVERNNTLVDGAGYTLQGSHWGRGIDLSGRKNVTIKNIEIRQFIFGIYLSNSTDISIYNNNITHSEAIGLVVQSSSDNDVAANTIKHNYIGIELEEADNNCISGNQIVANGPGGGMFLFSSTNNSISRNNITENDSGIRLEYSDNNTISENTIGNSLYVGVGLGESSDYNTVGENNISNNTWAAVKLYKATNNDIHKNNLTNNYQGIWLEWHSVENTIGINVIANNSGYGVSIQTFSNAIVEGNSITDNEWGLFIFSNDSTIYHNNFINNTNQATNYREEMENIWDDGYPSGGNYWSDYNGTDVLRGRYQNETGSDGIGDTPYVIDGRNQDNYPLMRPYAPLIGDLNGDGKVDIQDLVLFIKAFGAYPSHPRWNPSADLNKDNKVDIMDMVLLIKSFGKHYP